MEEVIKFVVLEKEGNNPALSGEGMMELVGSPEEDYICGTYHRLFQNVATQEPRHNTYHYLVLGFIHGVTQKEHQCYLRMKM